MIHAFFILWTFYHPTFCPVFLSRFFQVFPEAESAFVVGPGVVSAAAEHSPEVAVSGTEVFALVYAAVLFPDAVAVVEHEVVVFAAGSGIVSVFGPRASADIAAAIVVLVPASVFAGGVYSPGRPRSPVFPNVVHFSSFSSSDEVVGEGSVHSSMGARSNYGLCSILSNPDLYQNKSLEPYYNNPSPGHNNVNDTSDLPMDATTSHSRKTALHQCREQRKHRPNQVSLSHPVVREIRGAAEEY